MIDKTAIGGDIVHYKDIVGWYFNNSNYSIVPIYHMEVPINKEAVGSTPAGRSKSKPIKEFTLKPFLYGTTYSNDIDWKTGTILRRLQQTILIRKEHFFNTEEEARSYRDKVINA